jgi:hypothetical protein
MLISSSEHPGFTLILYGNFFMFILDGLPAEWMMISRHFQILTVKNNRKLILK